MRGLISIWCLAMVLICAAIPAKAQGEAGNALLESCTASANPADMERCIGYVAAIADVMRNGNAIYGWFACPPAADSRQIFDAVMKFRQWRKDLRHYSASALTAHALAATYPCLRR